MKAFEQTIAGLGDPIWVQSLKRYSERETVIARWRHSSARVAVSTPDAIRVVLSLRSGQRVLHAEHDQAIPTPGMPGQVRLFPAGVSTDTAIEGEADVVQIFISSASLASAAHRSPTELPAPYPALASEKLKLATVALFVAALERDSNRRDAAEASLRQIVDNVLSSPAVERGGRRDRLSPLELPQIELAIKAAIDDSAAAALRVEELATGTHFSVSHFIRCFRKTMGSTPHQLVMLRRDERAMDLLREPTLSVADVAETAGYSSPAHFVASFRRRLGVTPGVYQKAVQDSLPSAINR